MLTKTLHTLSAIPASIILLSSNAMAHPGHDHGHWSSSATHALLALAFIGVAAVGVWAYRHHQQKNLQQHLQQQEEK